MKLKTNLLFLFFLFFSTTNHLFAKYTGGNGNGNTVITGVITQLDGQEINASKYAGGSNDGNTVITGLITQLDGQQTSAVKYAGGSYDGYHLSSSDLLDLGGSLMFAYTKYRGDEYDGFYVSHTNQTYLNGIIGFADSKYYGDDGDGYFMAVAADGQDISLPVTLSLFALSEIPHQTAVKIDWRTESETENAFWLLLRKTENDSVFTTLNKITGSGNSSAAANYTFTDAGVQAGCNYAYQLADVSLSGKTTYHEEKSISVSVPKSFALFQNYPNPFNPNTNIKFALPVPSKIQLKIFNILGQKVVNLLVQQKKAGYHMVQWDGRNAFGKQVSSGMYIYLLQAEGMGDVSKKRFKEVKRMILMK